MKGFSMNKIILAIENKTGWSWNFVNRRKVMNRKNEWIEKTKEKTVEFYTPSRNIIC